jgi:hypothetical protein
MKDNLKIGQKITVIVLALIMVFGSYMPAKKAHAQWITTDLVTNIETGLTAVKSALSSVYNEIASYAEQSIWIKDYILDPLAWAEAKGLLQNITNETVNWINSGFNGSPAYITNPTRFFENMADQATGAFISQNGPLSSLCSPISLNVRLALALNQAGISGNGGGSSNPYTCTLSTIINNVQNASISAGVTVNGMSIAGFEGGDFSQGGWPAFAALAEPQNSFYGAYLEAQSSLDTNIANRTQQKNNELAQGQGFQTYQTCTEDPSITDEEAFDDPTIQLDEAATAAAIAVNPDAYNIYDRCENSTPGSTIKTSLDKAMGSSQDSLVQASMLDEIIGALAGQLVNKVLGPGGLAGVSQPSNGQPAYLTQIEAEASSSSATAGGLGGSLSTNLAQYITNTANIQSYASSSVSVGESALTALYNASSTCKSEGDTAVVSQIGIAIASTTAWITQLQGNYNDVTNNLNSLTLLSDQFNAATSTAEINALTRQYNSLISTHNPSASPYSQSVPSVSDVQNAKDDNTNVRGVYNSIISTIGANTTPNTYLGECYLYAHPANSGNSFF